jgi:hypothetical protein
MAIHFNCIRCGKGLKVRDELAGSEGQCPHCKVAFRVPATTVAGAKATDAEDFDPTEFLNEEPADTARKAAIPAEITADLEGGNGKGYGKKSGSKSSKSSNPDDPPPAVDIWDQAQAAREMRHALKASVKEAKEKRAGGTEGIEIDFRDALREYGPSVIGGTLLLGVVVFGVYWMFEKMMGDAVTLPSLGYVTGTVTLNEEPLVGATVYFAPLEETEFVDTKRGGKPRTSFGVTDAQGNYKMMYMEGVEGVAAGKCRVWIEFMDPSGRLFVPGDYSQAAMVVKEVGPGKQIYDMPMKFTKPKGKK